MADDDFKTVFRKGKGRLSPEDEKRKALHKKRRAELRVKFEEKLRDEYVTGEMKTYLEQHPKGDEEEESEFHKRMTAEEKRLIGQNEQWTKKHPKYVDEQFEAYVLEVDPAAAEGEWRTFPLPPSDENKTKAKAKAKKSEPVPLPTSSKSAFDLLSVDEDE